jgi:hypothetical protein
VGETLHFEYKFSNGSEAEAAVPSGVRKNIICALGMAVVAVATPPLHASPPARHAKVPFKAVVNQQWSIRLDVNYTCTGSFAVEGGLMSQSHSFSGG